MDLINLSPAGGCEFRTAWIAAAGMSVARAGGVACASAGPALAVVRIEKNRRVRRMRTSVCIVSPGSGDSPRGDGVANEHVFDERRGQPLLADVEGQSGDRDVAFALLGAFHGQTKCAFRLFARHALPNGAHVDRRGGTIIAGVAV